MLIIRGINLLFIASILSSCLENKKTEEKTQTSSYVSQNYLKFNVFEAKTLTCIPAAVELRNVDAYTPVPAMNTISFNLTTSAKIYTDANCSTIATNWSIAAGAKRVILWFKSETEASSINVNGNVLTNNIQGLQTTIAGGLVAFKSIEPVKSLKIEYIHNSNVDLASCIGLEVKLASTSGSYVNSTREFPVNLTSNNGKFYSDNLCTRELSQVSILQGANSEYVWVKSSNRDAFQINAMSEVGNATFNVTR